MACELSLGLSALQRMACLVQLLRPSLAHQ
uniref:Uncharacterized protein n=1 Tax=Arundo donax TaxID=35708 RepID=A0A0A9BZH1_ARUDO